VNFETENEGGMSTLSFILGLSTGIALGIIGTVVFATYQEEKFGHVVRKTREIGDSAQDTAVQLKDRVADKVGDVTEAAKNQIKKATGKLQEQVDNVRGLAQETVNN
jgi:gas vesicle protein